MKLFMFLVALFVHSNITPPFLKLWEPGGDISMGIEAKFQRRGVYEQSAR